jgi:hypothetical protein
MNPIQKHTGEVATAVTDLFMEGQKLGDEGIDSTFYAFAKGIGMVIGMGVNPEDQGAFLIEFYQYLVEGVMEGAKLIGKECPITLIVGNGEMPINKRF